MIAANRKNTSDPLVITLPESTMSPGQETLEIQTGLLIQQLLERYYEFNPDPEIASGISQMKAAIETLRENPNKYYVPGLRRYMQFVLEIFAGTKYLSQQDARQLAEGIEGLLELAKQAVADIHFFRNLSFLLIIKRPFSGCYL